MIQNTIEYFIKKVLPILDSPQYISFPLDISVYIHHRQDTTLLKIVDKGGYLPNLMKSELPESETEKQKPDNIHDEIRFHEDLDKMTGSYSIKQMLFLLMKSKNQEIESSILNIIFSSFYQRGSLVKILRKTDIMFTVEEIDMFHFISAKIIQLQFYIDQSELWLICENKKPKVIDTVCDILNDLVNCFYRQTKADVHSKPFRLLGVIPGHADNRISHSRQSMVHSLKAHQIILRLIKESTYILETLPEDANTELKINAKIVKLFRSCYTILLFMCKNNHKKGRKELAKSLDIFTMQLPFFQAGQSELICEILKGSNLRTSISDELINTFYKVIVTKGHNPSYMHFFDMILDEVNPELLEDNVNRIISIINDPERRNEFLFMEFNHNRSQYEFNLNILERKEGDYPFIYHVRALNVLIKLYAKTSNKNLVRFVIRNALPLNTILRTLAKNDFFSQYDKKYKEDEALLYSLLKIPLIQILKDVWIEVDNNVGLLLNGNKFLVKFLAKETEKMNRFNPKFFSEYFQKVRQTDFQSTSPADLEIYHLVRDAQAVVTRPEEKVTRSLSKFKVVLDKKDKARYLYNYYTYALDYLLPVMSQINLILTSPDLENPSDRKQALIKLLDFSIVFKKNYYKFQNPSTEDPEISASHMDEFIDVFQIEEQDLERGQPNEISLPRIEIPKRDEALDDLDSPLGKMLSNKNEQTSFTRLTLSLRNFTYIDTKEDQKKQKLWKSFIMNMSASDKVREYVQRERRALVHTILNVEKFEYDDPKMPKITLEGLIRKIITHIQNISESLQFNDSTRKSLSGSILLLGDLIALCKDDGQKKMVQGLMHKCQAVKMACGILFKQDMPLSVKKVMIYTCTQLLDGGNKEMQAAFYMHFTTDSSSENFFRLVFELISAELINYSRKMSSYEKAEKALMQTNFSNKLFRFNVSILLRLIQLFAEGHYSQLQVYFRNQTNSKTNYNIINLLVKLTETLLGDLTEGKYEILQQSLDTLIEFIQGPCYENQTSLANNKFIDIASVILQVSACSSRLSHTHIFLLLGEPSWAFTNNYKKLEIHSVIQAAFQ